MKPPAEDWNRSDAAGLLRPPEISRILVQPEMGPDFVVIRGVVLKNVAQERFSIHHEVRFPNEALLKLLRPSDASMGVPFRCRLKTSNLPLRWCFC
jgi:hypothetical protein